LLKSLFILSKAVFKSIVYSMILIGDVRAERALPAGRLNA